MQISKDTYKIMNEKLEHIKQELKEHLPFAIFATCLGFIMVGFIGIKEQSKALDLFEIFHPIHILFSTIATTAMVRRHGGTLLQSGFTGAIGSLVVCSISDIVLPYLGGSLFGVDIHLHICVWEHGSSLLPFMVFGIFTGLFVAKAVHKSTVFSHFVHVLVSTAASLLYFIGHGVVDWQSSIGIMFLVILFAVFIPCCISDIIFPLAWISDKCRHCGVDKDI